MKRITSILALVAAAGTAMAAGDDPLYGVVALNPQSSGALRMVGQARIEAPAVCVNSSASTAVQVNGSALLDVPHVYVMSGVNIPSSNMTGALSTMSGPRSDPFAGTAFPSTAGMPVRHNGNVSGGQRTLQPGYYPAGIKVAGGAKVTLNPGLYVVDQEFRVSSGNITGDGVTLVMQTGAFTFNGGSTAELTPGDSGAFAGVVIAQAPSNTSLVTLTGGSGVAISGTIYAPAAEIRLTGNTMLEGISAHMGDLVMGDRVSLCGQGTIKIGPHGELPLPARHD